MAVFSFGSKSTKVQISMDARIKVLGSGCAKCMTLEKNVKEALKNKGVEEDVAHVTDIAEIVSYGVMSTPALVIDEKVVSVGKILKPAEIEELI